MEIRRATPVDREALERVNLAAFPGPAEARLAEQLAERAEPLVSLLAEERGQIIGHAVFSPARLDADADFPAMALGPMAVSPEWQRQGVGSMLVNAGLEACRDLGCRAVFVLGHADYYPNFGFQPAAKFGIDCRYEVPEEYFMTLELVPGALKGVGGRMHYHPAFDELEED